MKNILILYNPYYQEDVIEQHLEILKDKGAVAFGKVKSKLQNYDIHPNENILNEIYENVSRDNPMQLFLTDYDSMFVANVIAVKKDKTKLIKAPKYYDKLDVEKWYIIDDIRLLIKNDFQNIRDNILSNFLATNFNNRTYAVYGNSYIYPMQITMKEPINYFEKDDEDFKYYNNVFKSDLELKIQDSLIDFVFTPSVFYKFASNTQENLISAELEYIQNKHNPLYDYSAVVIKYSKAVELELYRFIRVLFAFLTTKKPSLSKIGYTVQGIDYTLDELQEYKANYGTYKHLLRLNDIRKTIENQLSSSSLRYFIQNTIPNIITTMQEIRNEAAHGGTTTFSECNDIRNIILGIHCESFLDKLINNKNLG